MPTILDSIRRALSHRRTIRTLYELDDHLLRDIGLERQELERATRRRRDRAGN
jgi:uncharacterized protein YjiS (DUF1127 family)